MRERTFKRGDKIVSTETPKAATQLISEGWTEVEVPAGRPEPEFDNTAGELGGMQVAVNDSGSDERLVETGTQVKAGEHIGNVGQSTNPVGPHTQPVGRRGRKDPKPAAADEPANGSASE